MVLAVILPGFHEGILKTIFVDTWVSLQSLRAARWWVQTHAHRPGHRGGDRLRGNGDH